MDVEAFSYFRLSCYKFIKLSTFTDKLPTLHLLHRVQLALRQAFWVIWFCLRLFQYNLHQRPFSLQVDFHWIRALVKRANLRVLRTRPNPMFSVGVYILSKSNLLLRYYSTCIKRVTSLGHEYLSASRYCCTISIVPLIKHNFTSERILAFT